MREWSHQVSRWTHKLTALTGTILGGARYAEVLSREADKHRAWRKWWRRPHKSTLNAVIATGTSDPPSPRPPRAPRLSRPSPPPPGATTPMLAEALFDKSGWWEDPSNPMHQQRSGLLEDFRIYMETALEGCFRLLRWTTLRLALVPAAEARGAAGELAEDPSWADIPEGITPEDTPGMTRVGSSMSMHRSPSGDRGMMMTRVGLPA